MPGRYLLVFFSFPPLRNSFHGALPPMVGRSFLRGDSSPETDGPASAAIWANCRVGDDDGDLPTPSSLLASSTRPFISSNVCSTSLAGEELLAGEGWCTGEGGCFSGALSSLARLASRLLLLLSLPCLAVLASRALSSRVRKTVLPSLSFLGVIFVLAMLFENKERKL